MDNRVFNVNGKGVETLEKVLDLVFKQKGLNCQAWKVDIEKGMILYWTAEGEKDTHLLPTKMTAKEITPTVAKWLESKESKSVMLKGWDGACDHDGENEWGWRVYCEDWGH